MTLLPGDNRVDVGSGARPWCVPPEEAAALTATTERGRLAPGDAPYAAVTAFWREGPP